MRPLGRTFLPPARRCKKKLPAKAGSPLLLKYHRRFVFWVAMMVNTPKAMLSAAQMYRSE